jgi:hypothetical protein
VEARGGVNGIDSVRLFTDLIRSRALQRTRNFAEPELNVLRQENTEISDKLDRSLNYSLFF